MKNLLNLILILGLAFILTGCPPKETTPPEADGSKASMTLDDLDDEGELTDEQRAEDENAKNSAEQRKKLIKELVDNLKEFELSELEYQDGQTKIKVSKASKLIDQVKTSAVVSPNKSVLKSSDESEGVRIKSPIIGTAYLAPEPGAKKFVEVGDKIKKGQTVMIVEAMKTMNHVPSTADGEVKKILIQDGQPVEFGQTLVLLK